MRACEHECVCATRRTRGWGRVSGRKRAEEKGRRAEGEGKAGDRERGKVAGY